VEAVKNSNTPGRTRAGPVVKCPSLRTESLRSRELALVEGSREGPDRGQGPAKAQVWVFWRRAPGEGSGTPLGAAKQKTHESPELPEGITAVWDLAGRDSRPPD